MTLLHVSIRRAFRPIGFQDALIPIFFVSLLAVQSRTFAVDPGVGWHLLSGRYMLGHRAIPAADPFLAEARPWVAEQWLSDLIFGVLEYWGGWALLYAVLSVLYLFTYAVLLYPCVARLLSRQGASALILAACCSTFAFKLGQTHFLLRPVLFSFPLFTAVYCTTLTLYRITREHAFPQAQYRRALWFLPLVMMLWSNLHPSFPLGLAVLAALPIALHLDRLFFDETHAVRPFWLLLLLAAAATLLNAHGIDAHLTALRVMQSDFTMHFYDEWHAPDFRGFEGLLFEAPLLLICFALAVGRGAGLRWGFFELGMLLAFTHLSLQAARMLPYFAIVLTVPLGDALQSAASRFPGRRVSRSLAKLERREARSWRGGTPFLLCSAAVLIYALATGRLALYDGPFGPPASEYPYQAVEVLEQQAAGAGPPLIVANPVDWGSFIALQAWPRVRPIIDDRTMLLGEEFYREYFARLRPEADWRRYLKEQNASYLLLPQSHPLAAWLLLECQSGGGGDPASLAGCRGDGWQLRHADQQAALFELTLTAPALAR